MPGANSGRFETEEEYEEREEVEEREEREDRKEKILGPERIVLFGFDVDNCLRFVDDLIDPIDQVGVRQ